MAEPSAPPAEQPSPEKAATPADEKKATLAESATVKLSFPIKLGGTETNSITMRRPKVRDRLNMSRHGGTTDVDQEAYLIGSLCSIAPDEIEAMDMLDYHVLQNQLETFSNPLPLKT